MQGSNIGRSVESPFNTMERKAKEEISEDWFSNLYLGVGVKRIFAVTS